jgi:MFS transporter, AAHS family, 3-hydroxyphenylpropionic acid transporter
MDGNARTARITLFLCFLAALCEGADVQAAGVAAAGLAREYSPTPGQLGAFFSASNLGLLVGAIVGGRLADSLGRTKVVVASLGVFGAFSLLTAFAWSLDSLTWARALTGLGLGGAMPNLIALVMEASDATRRNRSIATTYVGFPIGGTLASLVMFLVGAQHWRRIFLVGGIAPLLLAPLMARFIASPAGAREAARDPIQHPFGDLFGRGLWSRTLVVWAGFLLIVLTLHLLINWLPLLLQGRGLGLGDAALSQAAFNVGGAAVAWVVGHLLDTRWRRPTLAVSVVGLPAALVAIANAPVHPGLMIGLALLLGGTVLAAQVILYGVAGSFYPAQARGTGVGAAVSAGRLGSLMGPLFASTLLRGGRTPTQVLMGLLPIVVTGLACVIAVAWRSPDADPVAR